MLHGLVRMVAAAALVVMGCWVVVRTEEVMEALLVAVGRSCKHGTCSARSCFQDSCRTTTSMLRSCNPLQCRSRMPLPMDMTVVGTVAELVQEVKLVQMVQPVALAAPTHSCSHHCPPKALCSLPAAM